MFIIINKWSVGVGAACKIGEVEEGSTIAIFGLGSVGLAVISIVCWYLMVSNSLHTLGLQVFGLSWV